jgi:16S rRNA G1207 methylase RsmC
MLKLSEYNDSINKFDGEEYDDLKLAWNNLYTEINKSYNLLKTNPPKINDKNYVFDLKNIKKCLKSYSKECMYFN